MPSPSYPTCRASRRTGASAPAITCFSGAAHNIARYYGGCVVALAVCMVLQPGVCFAADGNAANPANPTIAPDSDLAALLLKLDQEIIAGQTTSPPHRNAFETWQEVGEKTLPPVSPQVVKALDDFVRQARARADVEKAAGHPLVSVDLSVFADLASAEVIRLTGPQRPASPQAPQVDMAPAQERATSISSSSPAKDPAVTPAPAASMTATTPAIKRATAAVPEVIALAAARVGPDLGRSPGGEPTTDHPATAHSEPDRASDDRAVAAATFPAAPPVSGAAGATDPSIASVYTSRGDALLAVKDVSGARKFYEFAANAGSGHAAAELAQTYDPLFLAHLGAIGLQPDNALAVTWYQKAAALGDRDAAARLTALRAEAAR